MAIIAFLLNQTACASFISARHRKFLLPAPDVSAEGVHVTRSKIKRDDQQWILDWLVKTTGRVQNFANDERDLPPETKSYRMIPRVLYKEARHIETIAKAAEAAGHIDTARQLFRRASQVYHEAQHSIFEDDNEEKIFLHGKLIECYDKVASYVAELIDSKIVQVVII